MQNNTNDFSKHITRCITTALIITAIIFVLCELYIWLTISIHGYGYAFFHVHNAFWWRLVIIAVCLTALCLFFLYYLQEEKKLKIVILSAILVPLCIALTYVLAKDLITDLPYLTNPEVTYLCNLLFRTEITGDSGMYHIIEGTTTNGERESFYISEETYDEGKAYEQSSTNSMARIVHLPASEALYDISFTDHINEEDTTLFPKTITWNPDMKTTITSLTISIVIAFSILSLLCGILAIALHMAGFQHVISIILKALSPYLLFTLNFLAMLIFSIFLLLSPYKKVKGFLCATITGGLSIIAIFFFDYNLFLDIPYLLRPSTTFMRHFSFIEPPPYNLEEDTTTWQLEGYSIDFGYTTSRFPFPLPQRHGFLLCRNCI